MNICEIIFIPYELLSAGCDEVGCGGFIREAWHKEPAKSYVKGEHGSMPLVTR
jgi:hypothetical protein